MKAVRRFILDKSSLPPTFTAVSLFSAVGLSDVGYRKAGFDFKVHAEADPYRAAIGKENFPDSQWVVGDIRATSAEVIRAYKDATSDSLDLLVATPPCQGMSSSNPTRGKRSSDGAHQLDEKNALILEIAPVARALRPRFIVAENIRQLLTQPVSRAIKSRLVIDDLREKLRGYQLFCSTLDVADYGMPQTRKRSIIVGVRQDEPCLATLLKDGLSPWPKATFGTDQNPHVSIREWLEIMSYPRLDSAAPKKAKSDDPLHNVPSYDPDRYLQVKGIPPNSGRSAYQNDTCPDCGSKRIPLGIVRCPACAGLLRNRPYVFDGAKPRLITGFKSSYRRMSPWKPASTVTTNSSHVGSDIKIHPYEHRVLSARECAELQSVPRSYDWSKPLRDGKGYSIRTAVGEAFPPFFTYLHGRLLSDLLTEGNQLRKAVKNRMAHSLSHAKGSFI